eukprot:TRINITY_DN39712_c0_g1_i1.p1 TRINITY_DN39712_c0_g1~~TRINITY_DN39712_c0_g1_i1.p1  ORF type:complete len:388 (+),score=58.67 TRINITY_DN39712_c0_g1_i1:106-1269(+)
MADEGDPTEVADPRIVYGWLAVIASCVCFGSFGVAIKTPAVQQAKVHPLVFQSYKTFWTVATCWIPLFWVDLRLSSWGLLSGVFWVPAGIAAVAAVNEAGLAISQATWQVHVILVSFAWGRLAFHEPLKSEMLAVLGVLLLMCGLVGMTLAAASSHRAARSGARPPKFRAGEGSSRSVGYLPTHTKEGFEGCGAIVEVPPGSLSLDGSSSMCEEAGLGGVSCWPVALLSPAQQRGLAFAVFNGLWGGSNLVPMKLAGLPGPQFLVSFALGSAFVNVILWAAYVFYFSRNVDAEGGCRRLLPSMHWDVMMLPGMASGLLWAAGNMSAMYAVNILGQAVGYSCVQSSIIVSGLWGIFHFKEITGPYVRQWFLAALVALGGVVLLACQRK